MKYVTGVSGQHFENPYRQPLFLTCGIAVGQRDDRVGLGFKAGEKTVVENEMTPVP